MLAVKVDFALLLYDEFDGAPITDAGVLFKRRDKILTPLRKKEGFYVFCDVGEDETTLEIARAHYHKQLRCVIKNRLDPGSPVERIRLRRSFPGKFSDCEWLHGEAPPGSEVLAFAREDARLQPGDVKNRLTIPGQPAGRLLGRRFAFENRPFETFLLTSMPAPGVYQADRDLGPEAGAKDAGALLRAHLSAAGPDGRYHIPVEFGCGGRLTTAAYLERGAKQWAYVSARGRS